MSLLLSIILITLALIFYSIGVWAEQIARYLKKWHLIPFWIGFLFDISGTLAMHNLAAGPFNIFELHTLTGQLALWLMFAHAFWATNVVVKGKEKRRRMFHKYSIVVWIIWLIPYFGGIYIGINR